MDILKSWSHPEEMTALLKYRVSGCKTTIAADLSGASDNLKTCYKFLKLTSRSFAAVIQALDGELRDAVCIFYLVLRALDTVEDDMSIPLDTKIVMLNKFHTYLEDPSWKYMNSEEKDKIVLEEFPVISAEFRELDILYREVISDICQRMGHGMIQYLDRAPDTLQDWDQYCHYVAGLVGIGLSRLFSASKLEDELVGKDTKIANSMGLFLQKTNIIRDYLEDTLDAREFWPKQVWSKYCKELPELRYAQNRQKAMACLNELITNALQHVPDCITYMSRLKNQSIFNFCAIPQVMAIGTLERCYNNYAVFERVVKIRKGEAVNLMMHSTSIDKVKAIFNHYLQQVANYTPAKDTATVELTQSLLSLTTSHTQFISETRFYPLYVSFALMIMAIAWQYWNGVSSVAQQFT